MSGSKRDAFFVCAEMDQVAGKFKGIYWPLLAQDEAKTFSGADLSLCQPPSEQKRKFNSFWDSAAFSRGLDGDYCEIAPPSK